MTFYLKFILRENKYLKICSSCGSLNYYKNYKCKFCNSRKFLKDRNLILKELNNRIEFYELLGFSKTKISRLKEEF